MNITTKALLVAIIALISPISSFAASPLAVTTPGQSVRAATRTVSTGDRLSATIANNSAVAVKFSVNELQPYTTNLVSTITNGVNGMTVPQARSTVTQNIAKVLKDPTRHINIVMLADTFNQDPVSMEKFYSYGDASFYNMQCGNLSDMGMSMAVRSGLWNWSDSRRLSWNGQHTLLEMRQGQSNSYALTDFDVGMPSLTIQKTASPLEFASAADVQAGTATPTTTWTNAQGFSGAFGTSMGDYTNIISQAPNSVGTVTQTPLNTPLLNTNKFVLCPGCSLKWSYTHPKGIINAGDSTNLSRLNQIGSLYRQYAMSGGSATIGNQINAQFALLGIIAPDVATAMQSFTIYYGTQVESYVGAGSRPTLELKIPQNHANTIVIGPSSDLHIPLFVLGGTITGGSATIGTSTQSGTFDFPIYSNAPIGTFGQAAPAPTPAQIQVLTSGVFPPGVGGTIRLSYNPGAFSFVRGFNITPSGQLSITTSHLKPDVFTTAGTSVTSAGGLLISSVGGPLQP